MIGLDNLWLFQKARSGCVGKKNASALLEDQTKLTPLP